MAKKDFFSGHSKLYATFRPTYPKALYDFIFQHVKHFETAWDCATGNGQVAIQLATHFKKVYATDISQQQLAHAFTAENIIYSIGSAEETSFSNHQFDLITVGQALHWFDHERFYKEVKRVAKPHATLAVWGYNLCAVNTAIDEHVHHFYRKIVGPYWDAARKIVEEEYATLLFPFEEIPTPKFSIELYWTAEEFAGYLTTWSATQKFIQDKGYDPVPKVMEHVLPNWKKSMLVSFPVFLKLGKVS